VRLVVSLPSWVVGRLREITPLMWARYEYLVDREGWPRGLAAAEAGMSLRSAVAHDAERGVRLGSGRRGKRVLPEAVRLPVNSSGGAIRAARGDGLAPAPIAFGDLCDEARRAWDDFEFFRLRYFGHVSMPWQVEAAASVLEWLESPETVIVVKNVMPGAGKTTLKVDIAAWLTVRNRRIRGLFGSRKESNAMRDLLRLRRYLERVTPPRAKPLDLARGLAVDAEACLAMEFGSFKPLTREVWRRGEFVVAQFDEELVEEREPTWSCYGIESGILSNRFEFVAWDDIDDKATLRTMGAIEDTG
jgi:hypothetical protein